MHRAVCSKCGKDCEVPFRPTGDKPIYCNDCFGANRGSTSSFERAQDRSPRADRGGDRFPRRDFGSRPPRRSFNDDRGGFARSPQANDEVKKQLEFLGLKIDRLTKVVENLATIKVGPSKETRAEVKEVLKKVTKKRAVKKAKV